MPAQHKKEQEKTLVIIKKNMHYQAGQWVDFVRGLMSQPEREAMRAHLNAGCVKCREVAGLFARAVLRATADASYDPPEYAVQCARAVYFLQHPREVKLAPGFVAKLVYDSFRAPLPAGLRSQQQVLAHRLLYEAGPYHVDLRLQRKVGSPQVVMVGQIANREQPAIGIPNVPMLLLSEHSVLSKALSNHLGEFIMEYRPASSLRLYASVQGGSKRVEVRLGRAFSFKDEIGREPGRSRSRRQVQ
jgi:hypothetical protein